MGEKEMKTSCFLNIFLLETYIFNDRIVLKRIRIKTLVQVDILRTALSPQLVYSFRRQSIM